MSLWRSLTVLLLCLALLPLMGSRAGAWVSGYQPFPDGEATVVVHRFCRIQTCGPLTNQKWQHLIRLAFNEWNDAKSGLRFRPRTVRSTDDPCSLPEAVAVILADPDQLCSGDEPLRPEGRTEYGYRQARVYIHAGRMAP